MMLFSSSQIAIALGLTTRAIQLQLKDVVSLGMVTVRGQVGKGYDINSLPERMRTRLEEIRAARGYRTIEHLLSEPPGKWQPKVNGVEVSLNEIADIQISRADKLQKAFRPSLERISSKTYSSDDEIARQGIADYRQIFGYVTTERHWRRLIEKFLTRDNGANCFSRLELYLPDDIMLKPKVKNTQAGFENLKAYISGLSNITSLSRDEQIMLWHNAFIDLQDMLQVGVIEKEAKNQLKDFLFNSGVTLSRSSTGLEKSINRKFQRWNQGGCKPSAIADQRPLNSGNHSDITISENDRIQLLAASVERGGRISQGFRAAKQEGKLSNDLTSRFIDNPKNKSYVPDSIRKEITMDVKRLERIHHGPRNAKLNGAFIQRDYSDSSAGDWFQADDATMNHYYWFVGEDGKEHDMRGQFLLMIDVRTNYILGYCLNSERTYNARIIRSLIVHVHDQYGLPRKGFYFENGIWKAKVLVGRKDELGISETEQGLSEYVEFRHAKLPRSKVVERVLGIMQDKTEHLPGYVGRNEMIDKYEVIQSKLKQARNGKIEYKEFLLHRDQWIKHINDVIEIYNNEKQSGKLKGMSPKEAYEKTFNYSDPLSQLKSFRYLLSNHRKMMKVTRNGIRLEIAGNTHYYKNQETGKIERETVLVWYDMDEAPDFITITDLKRRNPRTIPRDLPVPSMTATNEQLRQANKNISDHQNYQKTLYQIVKPKFSRQQEMLRHEYADLDEAIIGNHISENEKMVKTQKKERMRQDKKIQRLSKDLGIDPMARSNAPDEVARGLEMINEVLNSEVLDEN